MNITRKHTESTNLGLEQLTQTEPPERLFDTDLGTLHIYHIYVVWSFCAIPNIGSRG